MRRDGTPGAAGVVADAAGRREPGAGVDHGVGAGAAPELGEEFHLGLGVKQELLGVFGMVFTVLGLKTCGKPKVLS